MAVDGPYDGEIADDAVHGLPERVRRPELKGHHVGDGSADTLTRPIDREEYYRGLRTREQSEPCAGIDRAEATADGGWKWKGLELDPAANRIADQAIAARREAEGRDDAGNYGEAGITPAMRRIEAELEHGTLVPDTERFALKSPDRFKEKLAKALGAEPDTSPADLASTVHDGIRYTFTFDERHYSDGVRQAERELGAGGFELTGRKPNWRGTEYKGINSQWCDSHSGQLFEVQFHTPESWDAKQRTHDAYERIECPSTSPQERSRLGKFQREVVAAVRTPPGALEFESYKAEGR
jgi:hypothetical protein